MIFFIHDDYDLLYDSRCSFMKPTYCTSYILVTDCFVSISNFKIFLDNFRNGSVNWLIISNFALLVSYKKFILIYQIHFLS
jgi:hypothetical protein